MRMQEQDVLTNGAGQEIEFKLNKTRSEDIVSSILLIS